jgi:hypothetical protein
VEHRLLVARIGNRDIPAAGDGRCVLVPIDHAIDVAEFGWPIASGIRHTEMPCPDGGFADHSL